jgi:hypothetical protein
MRAKVSESTPSARMSFSLLLLTDDLTSQIVALSRPVCPTISCHWVSLLSLLLALLMDFLNTDEKKQRRMVHLPMGRFGEAVELAQAALFRM